MTITVDEKLIEIARCLADSASQLDGSKFPCLAQAFAEASMKLLAQAIQIHENVKFVG